MSTRDKVRKAAALLAEGKGYDVELACIAAGLSEAGYVPREVTDAVVFAYRQPATPEGN